jgi:hypothetical protein
MSKDKEQSKEKDKPAVELPGPSLAVIFEALAKLGPKRLEEIAGLISLKPQLFLHSIYSSLSIGPTPRFQDTKPPVPHEETKANAVANGITVAFKANMNWIAKYTLLYSKDGSPLAPVPLVKVAGTPVPSSEIVVTTTGSVDYVIDGTLFAGLTTRSDYLFRLVANMLPSALGALGYGVCATEVTVTV